MKAFARFVADDRATSLPTARYSSWTWLAVRYFGRKFSWSVTGTRIHR